MTVDHSEGVMAARVINVSKAIGRCVGSNSCSLGVIINITTIHSNIVISRCPTSKLHRLHAFLRSGGTLKIRDRFLSIFSVGGVIVGSFSISRSATDGCRDMDLSTIDSRRCGVCDARCWATFGGQLGDVGRRMRASYGGECRQYGIITTKWNCKNKGRP